MAGQNASAGVVLDTGPAHRRGLTNCIWVSVAATAGIVAATGMMLPSAGVLSRHMIGHIVIMSILAPLIATVVHGRALVEVRLRVVPAALLQLVVIWGLHAPPVLTAGMHAHWLHAMMAAMLLTSSSLFWLSILGAGAGERWRSVASLLLTGKLFCMLAALFVFSPRLLYPGLASAHLETSGALSDQQLAGLIMITICPLSYILSAVAIVVIALREIADESSVPGTLPRRLRQA